MDIALWIQNGEMQYNVTDLVEGEIRWETERRGGPGKLTFSIIKDREGQGYYSAAIEASKERERSRGAFISFQEGDEVTLQVDGKEVFVGYVFGKSRTKEQIIQVTAYDQLRYLKNKDTYIYKGWKASQLLQQIAGDFQLKVGQIADTGYVIPSRIEDSQTLMDMVYMALDITLVNTGRLFVLYDDRGKLTLQDIEKLKTSLIAGEESLLLNFSYSSDIDSDTYNKIKLARDNQDTGKREVYIVLDSSNMKRWGTLQHYEKIPEDMNEAQAANMAQQLIRLKNRVHRTLSLECMGDLRIRAGSSLFVGIRELGDIRVNQYMLVEKCTHSFQNNTHTMKLDVRGDLS